MAMLIYIAALLVSIAIILTVLGEVARYLARPIAMVVSLVLVVWLGVQVLAAIYPHLPDLPASVNFWGGAIAGGVVLVICARREIKNLRSQ